MVVLQLLLCGFKFQSLLLYKEVDHPYLLDIGCSVEACAVFVTLGLDYCKAAFPISQCRQGESGHLGHFSDFIVFLAYFIHNSVHYVPCIFSFKNQLIILFGRYVHEVVVDGILRRSVVTHLIVQVRACGFSRISRFGYEITAFHGLALLDLELAEVGVACDIAVAVVNLNEVAVALSQEAFTTLPSAVAYTGVPLSAAKSSPS